MTPAFVLDPGHGGRNRGAELDGIIEKDWTLRISREVEKALAGYEQAPHYVVTRLHDQFVPNRSGGRSRVMLANAHGAPLVSIHLNQLFDQHGKPVVGTRGPRIFYPRKEHPVAPLAEILANRLGALHPGKRDCLRPLFRGRKRVYDRDFMDRQFMCLMPNRGGVNIECCFITDPKDRAWLRQESTVPELGAAIAHSLVEWHTKTSLPMSCSG